MHNIYRKGVQFDDILCTAIITNSSEIVYVPMCVDIIHPGHISLIEQASQLGDVVVGLLSDSAVMQKKRLPFMTYDQRYAVVNAIKSVSEVMPQETTDYTPNLIKLKPSYVVHGDDWSLMSINSVINTLKAWRGELLRSFDSCVLYGYLVHRNSNLLRAKWLKLSPAA